MKTIGYIEGERLGLIPPNLWIPHEFCFYLHDQIVELLIQYENSNAHNTVIEAIYEAAEQKNINLEELDLLQFLKEIDNKEPYNHYIFSHVVMGLVSDMLHFLCESLKSFEKHKISVAFSLLRKPLKEHLFFLSWILADEDDFIHRFETDNYKQLSRIPKEKKISVFKKAVSKVAVPELFDENLIWDIIYSKNQENGFEPTWQRATHLITSYGDLLKTEDYNINFIFENSTYGYFHEFLYSKLPYILLFVTQVTFECFNRIHAMNHRAIDYSVITTMGCYEALFLDGRKQAISRLLKRTLGDFFKCIHCDADLKIRKKHAPLFYLKEQVYCDNCNLISEFPLYWLLAKAKFSITREKTDE